jgi:hypothetical protein
MRLRTGDLVLLAARRSSWAVVEWALEAARGPLLAHVGLVLVDPPFETVPSGAYIWETADGAAARLRRLDAVDASRVVVRRCARPPDARALQDAYREVHLKPHDERLDEWLGGGAPCCSAFVAFVLTRLGWLAQGTDWSVVRPEDLAASGRLAWTEAWYGADERVARDAWASMVARRAPRFDDHRACLAKTAALGLAVRGARVTPPVDDEPRFVVEGARGRASVLVPASEANRGRYEAHMPLLYELAAEGARPLACTEAELFALAV